MSVFPKHLIFSSLREKDVHQILVTDKDDEPITNYPPHMTVRDIEKALLSSGVRGTVTLWGMSQDGQRLPRGRYEMLIRDDQQQSTGISYNDPFSSPDNDDDDESVKDNAAQSESRIALEKDKLRIHELELEAIRSKQNAELVKDRLMAEQAHEIAMRKLDMERDTLISNKKREESDMDNNQNLIVELLKNQLSSRTDNNTSSIVTSFTELNDRHRDEISKLNDKHKEIVYDLNNKHRDEISRMSEIQAATVRDLNDKYKEEISRLSDIHNASMRELKATNETHINDIKEQLRALQAETIATIARINEEKRQEVASTITTESARQRDMESRLEAQHKNEIQRLQDTVTAEATKYRDMESRLEAQHKNEIQRLQDTFTAKETLLTMSAKQERESALMIQKMESITATATLQRELDMLKSTAEPKVAELTQRLAITEMDRNEAIKKIDSLQKQIDEMRNKSQLDNFQAQLEKIRLESASTMSEEDKMLSRLRTAEREGILTKEEYRQNLAEVSGFKVTPPEKPSMLDKIGEGIGALVTGMAESSITNVANTQAQVPRIEKL